MLQFVISIRVWITELVQNSFADFLHILRGLTVAISSSFSILRSLKKDGFGSIVSKDFMVSQISEKGTVIFPSVFDFEWHFLSVATPSREQFLM